MLFNRTIGKYLVAIMICLCVFISAGCNGDKVATEPIRSITFTLLDEEATGYGTFQSHNQKVLQIDGGIFTSHLTDGDPNPRIFRISRSVDGGKSFSTVYDFLGSIDNPNPPALETDGENIYIFRGDMHQYDLWMGVLGPPNYINSNISCYLIQHKRNC